VCLGLDEGLLKQLPIADGTGTAAKAAPLSGEGLDTPAELMGSAADGLISATGTAMQEEMNGAATAALEQGGGDALNGPGQITPAPGDDNYRVVDKNRRRRQAREDQCSGRGHCSRRQAHGYRPNERGKLSEDFVAAGDGLVAFGATFILPVQAHCRAGRTAAGQRTSAKRGPECQWGMNVKKPPGMSRRAINGCAAARGQLGQHPGAPKERAAQPPQPRERGQARHHPPHRPQPGGRRRLADARHGEAVAR